MIHPFRELVRLFYPNLCLICGQPLVQSEQFLCLHCHCNLPKTNYYTFRRNPTWELFSGFSQLSEAISYLFFEKEGMTQKLIHILKYYGNKELATFLGRIAAHELKPSGAFASIDTILPIPLHPKKEKLRGYNQSVWIAQGIASVYGCNVDTKRLKRLINTSSQTNKSIYDRHINVENIFEITEPDLFCGKHILLIDDVITTGATINSCIEAFRSIPDIRISIFSLAFTHHY